MRINAQVRDIVNQGLIRSPVVGPHSVELPCREGDRREHHVAELVDQWRSGAARDTGGYQRSAGAGPKADLVTFRQTVEIVVEDSEPGDGERLAHQKLKAIGV